MGTTRQDLTQLMVQGKFREDLYYRLNTVHIDVPSLAQRREDIPLLVAHFLEQLAVETGERKIYSPEAVEFLATADWPGNVRQLQAVVRQNATIAQTAVITALIAVWLTARRLVGALGALLALLILNGTHYVHFTAAKFNHDVIQLPFWALAGYAFHSALRRERLVHWA